MGSFSTHGIEIGSTRVVFDMSGAESKVARVAQVAHRRSRPFDVPGASTVLSALSNRLPETVKVVVTGGGFVLLKYSEGAPKKSVRRTHGFLEILRVWTQRQIEPLMERLRKISGRDFLIGVDVSVDGDGSGQFAAWVGPNGVELVSKRFPVGGEATYLAGFDEKKSPVGPRIVQTSLGAAMLLVCHDAQAFNHRNQANVRRAAWYTPRWRSLDELETLAYDSNPKWIFDLIHCIEIDEDLVTFKKSFKQVHMDLPSHPKVIGAFGYGTGKENKAPGWLAALRPAKGVDVVTVVLRQP